MTPDDNRPVATGPSSSSTSGGWSLRTRLLLGVIALVVVAVGAFGVGTAVLLRSYQIDRADDQLADLARRELLRPGRGPGGGRGQGRAGAPDDLLTGPGGAQPGSIAVQLFDDDGTLLQALPAGFADEPEPLPDVVGLTYDDAVRRVDPQTVGAQGDPSFRYRVRADPVPARRQTLVYGVPLARDDATLNRLLILEAVGGGLVVLAAALVGLRVIRVGLRPLDDMTDTATAIAGGDLSRRVGMAGERRDEVGRLGRALDTMLGQIEAAFAQRANSEGRLRRFVADASHELRTPLTSIRGYAELHRRGMLPDDQVDDAMRRIEAEAVRMGSLVEDLLLLARLDEGRTLERMPVDLAAVVADAVRDLAAVDPERTVRLQADNRVVVDGDPVRLHQVVANLLDNARKHTPAGTVVTVTVGEEGSDAVVRVTDEGSGLAPELATRIFDRSFRGERTNAPAGSGLGLSIVAAIVAGHDGTVTVDSTPGHGATFVVRLPRSDTPAEPGTGSSTPA